MISKTNTALYDSDTLNIRWTQFLSSKHYIERMV